VNNTSSTKGVIQVDSSTVIRYTPGERKLLLEFGVDFKGPFWKVASNLSFNLLLSLRKML